MAGKRESWRQFSFLVDELNAPGRARCDLVRFYTVKGFRRGLMRGGSYKYLASGAGLVERWAGLK